MVFSLSSQNIARSTTHNWKTQKCAYPDCVKWLSEYTQHDPEDPAAAAAALYDNPAKVMVKVKSRAFEDEEEDEEENRFAQRNACRAPLPCWREVLRGSLQPCTTPT